MSEKKIFSTKEEADKYLNCLVVAVSVNDVVFAQSFHTKEQAEDYRQAQGMQSAFIMTRRQFERYKKDHPELHF